MAKKAYIGNDGNVARTIKKSYIGDDNNVARKITKGYIGDANGIAQLFMTSGYTVTLVVGNNNGWKYGLNSTGSYVEYIRYSIDGGSTWVDATTSTSKKEGDTLATISDVSTIMFKCYVSGGRTYKAAVGTTSNNYNIVDAAVSTETISNKITITADTTFYLSLWASNVF